MPLFFFIVFVAETCFYCSFIVFLLHDLELPISNHTFMSSIKCLAPNIHFILKVEAPGGLKALHGITDYNYICSSSAIDSVLLVNVRGA